MLEIYPDTMREMLVHLGHLFSRAIGSFASSLGGTMLGILILPAVALILRSLWSLFQTLRVGGRRELRSWCRASLPRLFKDFGWLVGVYLLFYTWVVTRIVWQDHRALLIQRNAETAKLNDATAKRTLLEQELYKKTHSLQPSDPAFQNMMKIIQVWMTYRHAIGYEERNCMILFSSDASTRELDGTLMNLAVVGARCPNGNLLNVGVKPENQEAEELKGVVPGVIVLHALPDAPGVNALESNLSNLVQVRRSYKMPGHPGPNTIWLQIGPGTKWNSQL